MLPDHSTLELSVYTMVLSRLPFLENTPENMLLASQFTLEMMEELENCFRVNEGLTIPPDTSRIGDENNYTMPQRVILADLVSYYLLFRFSVIETAGDANDPTAVVPTGSFLKGAKAGSVEVTFEQLDTKNGSMLTSSITSMLEMFKKSAIRKAQALGCTIDVCDDCVSVTGCAFDIRPAGFIVTPYGDCYGADIVEQG